MASYGPPPGSYLGFNTSHQPTGFETTDHTGYPLYPPYPSYPPYPASPPYPSYDNEPAYLPHVPQDIYCLGLDESDSHSRATKSDYRNGDKYGKQPLLCGFEGVASNEITNKIWSPRRRGIQVSRILTKLASEKGETLGLKAHTASQISVNRAQ